MIQINLVPDVKLELISAQRHRNMVISVSILAMIASVVVVVVLGAVIGGQRLTESYVTKKIEKTDEEFRSIEDIEKTVTVQNQLESIQSTHDQKFMMSRVFDLLTEASAKGTENSVTLTSFTIDSESQRISLLAQTDNRGFEAAEVFRKNIDGMKMYYTEANENSTPNEFLKTPKIKLSSEEEVPIASDVELADVAYAQVDGQSQRSVNFRLSFTYDERLFSNTVDILRIRGLSRGNVTDSYDRLPASLFSNSASKEKGQQ